MSQWVRNLGLLMIGMVLTCGALYAQEPASAPAVAPADTQLLVLCYHDVPREVDQDNFAVDQESLVQTIEYLRTHGYHFVSLKDLIDAKNNVRPLPPHPVLLTFDDAYESYYDFVFPLLKQYRIPSVLAVVSGWIDHPPGQIKQKIMTWPQLQEVSKSGLVEIASHSHHLHQGLIYNPQGNEDAAAVARFFDVKTKSYEPDEAYQERIWQDMLASKKELEGRLGVKIRSIAWPYGKYNAVTMDAAKRAGIEINFALNDKLTPVTDLAVIERFLVFKNPELSYLLRFLKIKPDVETGKRIIQVDLDTIYDPDDAQTEKNLGMLLDRVLAIKPTTIFLQAFADPDGSGNVSSVYFPNRVLPVRADLFNRVAHQLHARCEVEVYAWMPMLALVLPDAQKTAALGVKMFKNTEAVESSEPYRRLSPFEEEVQNILVQLYEDMAKNADIDGVLFQDDGYLTDREDFAPAAKAEYLKITSGLFKNPEELSDWEQERWTHLKTDRLIALTDRLKKAVRYYRPEARFARNVYTEVVTNPPSEEWYAQNFYKMLHNYDYVILMAYPYLEGIKGSQTRWLEKLVDRVKKYPDGLNKTVFKVQAMDWRRKRWIDSRRVNQWLSTLTAHGAVHLGYYPDDCIADHPALDVIKGTMSTEEYPYQRK